ncbi:MAG: hypothetical protein WD969_13775, partial [Paracoccaceae bacterium]
PTEEAQADLVARDPHAPKSLRQAAREKLRALAQGALTAAKSALEPRNEALAAPAGEVIRSTVFAEIAAEYETMFAAARPHAERAGEIAWVRSRILRGRSAYEAASRATGAPWVLIGLIHGLEASFDFSRHLHNGDPLTARTRHAPAGRPAAGEPPFTWEFSAADALRGHGLHEIRDWSLARALFELERFNGFGYRHRRAPSPYLWSFSDRYRAGKFVRDGVFDPDAVSAQAGAATVLKTMIAAGDVTAPHLAVRSAAATRRVSRPLNGSAGKVARV